MDRLDAFVTGGTGLIGRWLVPQLTRAGRAVGVLARGGEERASEYLAWVERHEGDPSRVRIFAGDLGASDLGLSTADRALAATAPDFYHLGAAFAFGLDPGVTREINENGTRRLLELAVRASALRRFVHISGFRLAHAPKDEAGLRRLGAYEASKIRADRLARAFAQDRGLPLTVVHPGTVIGDSRTGETTLFWGFSDLVRDLFFGKVPVVPGGKRHWMPLVCVDLLASFLAKIPELPESEGAEYFLLDDTSPTMEELFERITRYLGVTTP